MHLGPFGCVWMHSEAFGAFWKISKHLVRKFSFFAIFWRFCGRILSFNFILGLAFHPGYFRTGGYYRVTEGKVFDGDVLPISLLIRQPQNKCVAESNNLLGFHRLLDSASHCTNSGSDLLDSAVCMHFTIYFCWGAKPPP